MAINKKGPHNGGLSSFGNGGGISTYDSPLRRAQLNYDSQKGSPVRVISFYAIPGPREKGLVCYGKLAGWVYLVLAGHS